MHLIYRILLYLYPAHYREEFGSEMSRLFRDRTRHEGVLRVAFEVFPDLLLTAWKEHMDTLYRDLAYVFRGMARRPGFAAVVLITLAVGVGANTAVFSVVKGVLLDPLPYSQPDQLVQLYEKRPKQGRVRNSVSAPDFLDWKKQNTVFEDVAALSGWAFTLPAPEGAQFVDGARVTANFFTVLGVKPSLGRDFLPEEELPGKDRVLVLSHGCWLRRFGGDTGVIGRKIQLGAGEPYEIVGVLPDIGNLIASESEIWQPLVLRSDSARGAHSLNVYARMKAGVSLAQARAAMDVVAAGLEKQYPNENTGHGINIFLLEEELIGKVRTALFVLFGAVGLVLLVACANVANLFIARAAQRRREISIRSALGAGAGRLVRQMLTEGVVLSLIGAGIGLLLAYVGVRALVALNPGNLPRAANIRVDGVVLLFTFVVAASTGLLFGLAPALHASRAKLSDAMKRGGRNATDNSPLRKALVVAEVAFALLLVVGSGLMLRSFARLSSVDPGFDPANVLAVDLPLFSPRYAKPEERRAIVSELAGRIRQLPGVQSVGAINALPLTGRDSGSNFSIEGHPPVGYSQLPNGRNRVATPGYFQALRIPLRAGRFLTDADRDTSTPVLMINETMARQYWPDEDALGKRISLSRENKLREIVGIVGDVKHYALDGETRPEMYVPYSQSPETAVTMVLRTSGEPQNLVAAVRGEIRQVDRNLPVAKTQTLESVLATSLAQPKLYSTLLTIFSSVALLLAAIGIYGVMSFSVAQRSQEMGVRMALGARSESVYRLVLKEGLVLTAFGIVLGLGGCLAMAGVLDKILYQTETADPFTVAVSAVVLLTVATLACYVPARRATRVDPIVALRAD